MFWMFELMSMMFILMFSELAIEKKQMELEANRDEIIQMMEDIYKKREELRRHYKSERNTPYEIPTIRPPHGDKNN
jgi:hypothetical protein